VDDVVAAGEDEEGTSSSSTPTADISSISGAFLNRLHKTAVLGLGGWAGRKVWSLD
jgi:hypothetical protein